MRITKIEYLPAGAAAVYIDEEKAAELDAVDISELGLSRDMELDNTLLSKIHAHARRFHARRRAFASVARADFSRKGLERRLSEKGIDKKSAADAASYLERLGYVNDEAFASRIAQAYGPEKCYGPRRVEQELWKRGIPKDISEAVLAQLPPEEELIEQLFAHRFSGQDLSDQKVKKRVFDALLRYGFSFDAIRRELQKHAAGIDFEE